MQIVLSEDDLQRHLDDAFGMLFNEWSDSDAAMEIASFAHECIATCIDNYMCEYNPKFNTEIQRTVK